MGAKKKLHITINQNGQTSKRTFEVSAVILGRSPECLVQINHVDVSRKHLNIYIRDGNVWIEDMGSSNGTYLNTVQIKALTPYQLTPEDVLHLGKGTGIAINAEVEKFAEALKADTVSMALAPAPILDPETAPIEKIVKLENSNPDTPAFNSHDSRQKFLRTAQEEAAEIIRNARIQAEHETQSIFDRAQNTQKQAEEFYRRRLQEASTDAEELRSNVRRETESLLEKTRQSCEDIRKQVDASITELRTKTRQECDQMYEDMEAQVKQVKDHRIREMDEGIALKESQIIEDARNRMAIAEKEQKQSILASKELHQSRLKADLDQHQARLREIEDSLQSKVEAKLRSHAQDIAEEKKEHDDRLLRELQEHESKISDELNSHTKRLTDELELHNQKMIREISEHNRMMEQKREEFAAEENRLSEQILTSQAKAADLSIESDRLQNIVTDLKNSEASLMAVIDELEASNKLLHSTQSELSLNIQNSRKDLENLKKDYELLHRSHQVLIDKKQQAQNDFDADILRLKTKLQSEKDRHLKEEKENLLYLKQESEKKIQHAEKELLSEIARKKYSFIKEILLQIEKSSVLVSGNLTEWRKEGSNLEKAILTQVEGQLFAMQIDGASGPKNLDISKHKRKEKMTSLAYGFMVGVLLMIGVSFGLQKLNGPSPLERAVASEAEARKKDLEKRKFDPVKSYDLKSSYSDAVLYTEKYYELTTTDEYQQKWSLALAKHMLKLWKVDEDSSIKVASIANALVKKIQERKTNIHPDYVQDGLKKIKDLEAESVKRMVELLGSQVRYESLKKFEQDFFLKYRAQQLK